MSESKKPHIKLMITREMFNTLFTMFTYFESFEISHGNSYHIHYSKLLKAKIMKYGRLVKAEGGDDVLLYFFPNEAIQLINILAMYSAVKTDADEHHFNEFLESKKEQT
jgi:hypothetical protein